MEAYKVFIDGYEAESSAYVLAVDRETATARALPNLDATDDQSIRVVRVPSLDGDEISDQRLWDHGLATWFECTWCGERLRRGSHNVLFDRNGRIYCNGVCILDARIPEY
jgi:hypothetical protein